MSETAKASRFIQLKIFGGKIQDEDAVGEEIAAIEEQDRTRKLKPDGSKWPSAYVTVFEDMVNTVLEHEAHLLSKNELEALDAFSSLCYNSRYCLIRMMLLKPKQWNPLSAFEKWKDEVGNDGILPSVLPLCQPIKALLAPPVPLVPQVKQEQQILSKPDIIDLTESDDEDVKPKIEDLEKPVPGPSKARSVLELVDDDPITRIIKNSNTNDLNLDYLCESDEDMTLLELLNSMKVDQLKDLANQNHCSPKIKRKAELVQALFNNATSQGVLTFAKKDTKGKGKVPDPFRQTLLPFKSLRKPCPRSQEHRLRAQIMQVLGRCFRVNHDFYRLARRVHVIAYRCTEHPTRLMLPALLTTFKKRAYADYMYTRDVDIWASRVELLDYEEAMELDMLLDEIIEAKPEEQGAREGSKAPKNRATPATSSVQRTPLKTSKSIAKKPDLLKKEEDVDVSIDPNDMDVVEDPPDSHQVQKARKIVQYLDEWILYRWKIHLEFKQETNAMRTPSLQRFEPGYIYSRMLRKALTALASLKEYQRELELIEIMLSQRLFLRGKRAKLYERRAVLQTRYLCKTPEGKMNTVVLRQALEGVREALLDDDTILVTRPSLVRRLRRLEKKLKVPEEERAVCEGELRIADTVEIVAKRIFHRESSLRLDSTGKPITNKENISGFFYKNAMTGSSSTPNGKQQPNPSGRKRTGKSIWEGRNSLEVNVEQRALEYYEDLGFKGFHAETSILTTIFGLLFWDIIFADIRGAFETKFQSAPLDIVDDSFYYARQEMIEARLEELREGKGCKILERHYTRHRESKTWCIGVQWDICEKQDLIEILECLGGKQLASVCKLFCEDYTGRCSGAPDLIAWNAEHRICKFIEVKGPGDTPQENQKLWFDSLLAAGIDVEICKVIDANDTRVQSVGRQKGRSSAVPSTKKRKRGKAKDSCSDSEGEDQDYDKLDAEFEDELPQLPRQQRKRRRGNDPGQSGNLPQLTPLQSLGAPSM